MEKKLNPGEAPPGYIAVPHTACGACALNNTRACADAKCITADRDDRCSAGFVKRPPARPAFLLDIVAEALKARGFDGLYRSGICACRLDDLSPGSCMTEACSPGVLLENETCDICAAGNPCSWHIGTPPEVGDPLRKETP